MTEQQTPTPSTETPTPSLAAPDALAATDADITHQEAATILTWTPTAVRAAVRDGRFSPRPDRDGRKMVSKSEVFASLAILTAKRNARAARNAMKAELAAPTNSEINGEAIEAETVMSHEAHEEVTSPDETAPHPEILPENQPPAETVFVREESSSPVVMLETSVTTEEASVFPVEEKVSLQTISFDPEVQLRVAIRPKVVTAYAALMKEGQKFPPVDLFREGDTLFIGDGNHRLHAARKNGYHNFPARVRPGGRAAARRWALEANKGHGLALTSADKRRKVEVAFEEYGAWSNTKVARICGVSEAMVRGLRDTFVKNEPATRLGEDGKTYPARKPGRVGSPRQERALYKQTEKLIKKLTLDALRRLRASIDQRLMAILPDGEPPSIPSSVVAPVA